jgi:hypothetical protein
MRTLSDKNHEKIEKSKNTAVNKKTVFQLN